MATKQHSKPLASADAELFTRRNELDSTLTQLCAMLLCSFGGAGESFRELNDMEQDNFLWACYDKARDCQQQFDSVARLIVAEAA